MIKVGSKIAWIPESGGKPVIGTVRKFHHLLGVRVDDGDPANADIFTNGWRHTAWVALADLTEIT